MLVPTRHPSKLELTVLFIGAMVRVAVAEDDYHKPGSRLPFSLSKCLNFKKASPRSPSFFQLNPIRNRRRG